MCLVSLCVSSTCQCRFGEDPLQESRDFFNSVETDAIVLKLGD